MRPLARSRSFLVAAGVFLAFTCALLASPSAAQAGDMRISPLGSAPDTVQIAGAWAAWDDYGVYPANYGVYPPVVRWRDLEAGTAGTVAVPGLAGRNGTSWAVGEGFVAWYVWDEGETGGLYTEQFVSGERRKLAGADDGVTGFVTDSSADGPLLYWVQGQSLHCLNVWSDETNTYPAPPDGAYNFDVGGDWLVWAEFADLNPLSTDGVSGTVLARRLSTGEQWELGSVLWANLQDEPPTPQVDGHWAVWTTDNTTTNLGTSAFACELYSRSLVALDERIGGTPDPYRIRVCDGWIAWMDVRGDNIRSHVMDLEGPPASIPVSKTPGFQYRVTVGSDWAVWLDDRETKHGYMVYARRLDEPPEEAFPDIASSPYREAIEGLAATNVVSGFDDGTFRAGTPVRRAQYTKMLVRSLELDVEEGATALPFTDVERPSDDLYPDDYVAVAFANGLVEGYGGGLFKPYTDVSRAQILSMVIRAARSLKPWAVQDPPNGWKGVLPASDKTHGENIACAEFSGLLDGIDLSAFSIYGKATRGEIAQILWNLKESAAYGLPDLSGMVPALPDEILAVDLSPKALLLKTDHSLYAYVFAEHRLTELPIAQNVYVGGMDIADDLAVWTEAEPSQTLSDPLRSTLYACRLPDGPKVNITADGRGPWGPCIDGGRVFWAETTHVSGDPEQGETSLDTCAVWVMEIGEDGTPQSSPVQVTDRPNSSHEPGGDELWSYDVEGSFLAYQRMWGEEPGVHLLDLDSADDTYLGEGDIPSLSSSTLAWRSTADDAGWQVRGHDLQTGETSVLARSGHMPLAGPGYVLFAQNTGGTANDVYLLDEATGSTILLGSALQSGGYPYIPMAGSADYVAWVTLTEGGARELRLVAVP